MRSVRARDKLPAGTLAIVVSDPKGKPKSWGLAKPALNGEIVVFDSGDCQVLPNGTTPSQAGDLHRAAERHSADEGG